MKCPLECASCTRDLEEGPVSWLDQCQLTRLPARSYIAVGCPKDVVVTLATGDRWRPYTERK